MRSARLTNAQLNDAARTYSGPYRHYDIVKEVIVCTGIVTLLAVVLTIVFSSPDLPPTTIKGWSTLDASRLRDDRAQRARRQQRDRRVRSAL